MPGAEPKRERQSDPRPAPPTVRSFRSSGWLILTVLAGTLLGFVGAVSYSERSASKLDADAMSIAADASPAIQHLTAARGEILRIQLEAASAIQSAAEGGPPDRTSFDASFSGLHRELAAYLTLPFYPEERVEFARVEAATRLLETQVSSFSARISARDLAGARSVSRDGIAPAATRLDQAMERLILFNTDQQQRLAIEIPKIRKRANIIGYLLEAVTAMFGVSLMLLVIRAVRGYSRVLDDRRRLAEGQSTAAVAFSSRLESIARATAAIAEAIASRAPLQATFAVVAEEARAVVGADFCALGFGSDPERPFEPWASSGMTAAESEPIGRCPRPVGLLGAVLREGRPIRLDDLTKSSEFRGLPDAHPPMGPFIGVPVVHQNRNVGNLYLARRAGQPGFTAEDERAAALLAAYVGVAADNARLFGETQAAVRAREDLLAMVSHDLKNPLNAIRLSTELLRRSLGEGRATEITAQIDRATGRILQMIGDLLDAAKIEAGHLRAAGRPEDVSSLVDEAAEMFSTAAAAKGIELSHHSPPSALAVRCERDLLLRVFSNLIGNAIKFTPSGGSISVVAEQLAGQVHFSIKDSGPGIPADHLPHIFDRYWQQHEGDRRGSGLGLYIARGIVEAHGGRIWAESQLGQGSTIQFALPPYRNTDDSAQLPS